MVSRSKGAFIDDGGEEWVDKGKKWKKTERRKERRK
jgi:hypothetical protein